MTRGMARCRLILLLMSCMALCSEAQEWIGVRPRVLPWSRSGSADRVRLGVRTEGFYSVTASEVATAMGLSNSVVSSAFQTTNLTLSCQGTQVACSVQVDTLVFKGMPAVARVPENVYWLQLNTGGTPLSLPPPEIPTNAWEYATTTRQGVSSVSYLTMGTLTNLPSYLAFISLSGGTAFTLTNSWTNGISQPIDGELSVTLLSTADDESLADEHAASITLNGVVLGTNTWVRESYQTFTYVVPGNLLTNGVAVVKVKNEMANETKRRFFWTRTALTVAKQISEPSLLYPSVRGVFDADGMAADNVADYVVLIPPEGWVEGFRTTLQPLVDFRAKQGLRTAILDVEALYNRFTYGLADPEAIRSFCRAAYQASDVKLRYLLLAGSGSLDFAHEKFSVTNYLACLLPPLILPQRFSTGEAMIVAADQAFGDVTGNAAPEIAVGRFPTAWTQELTVAVSKTLAYEEALPWKSKAAVSAGLNFTDDMDIVKGPLTNAGQTVTAYYPATSTTWKNDLKPAFQSDLGSFWFIGHSDTTYLGNSQSSTEKLLEVAVIRTNNWAKMPIAILMGCHLNRWQSLNANESVFGPFSLFCKEAGFSAVIASTGYAWDGEIGALGESQRLALYLSEASGSNGLYRIGDALCAAEQRLAVFDPQVNTNLLPNWDPEPITAERLQSYSLVGDPAMMWRHDFSATGTPASWLLSYGLTAADGDVSDGDGDGWLAWQEYQAGTRPDTNSLHLAGQSFEVERGRLGLTFESAANARYRVLWKSSLESAEPWTPSPWTSIGATGDVQQASTWIVPSTPLSSIEIPLQSEYKQGFFKIEQME
jgi:Peptidase family C25